MSFAPLRVAAYEQDSGDSQRQRAIADEQEPAGPRGEAVGPVREREDLPAGFAREVLGDCVVPASREDVYARRDHEEDRSEGCDSARGIAHDRSDSEREDGDEHNVNGTAG